MGRILRVFPFLAFYGVKCSYVSFNNDSSDDNTSRCQDFNSIYWKMRYNRKESCQQAGCDFEGNKWFGKCKSLNVSHDARMNLKAPNSGPNPIYSLLVTKDSSEDVIIAIEGLMKDKFTSTVADSIEKSHEAAHEVAKALVLDVLRETSNIEHVGTILSHIFADETVLKSTRALAYFYLHTDETMDSISYQLNRLRFYYCRGGGKVFISSECLSLIFGF